MAWIWRFVRTPLNHSATTAGLYRYLLDMKFLKNVLFLKWCENCISPRLLSLTWVCYSLSYCDSLEVKWFLNCIFSALPIYNIFVVSYLFVSFASQIKTKAFSNLFYLLSKARGQYRTNFLKTRGCQNGIRCLPC